MDRKKQLRKRMLNGRIVKTLNKDERQPGAVYNILAHGSYIFP
jgi:hypothetical protein